jgi:hypothetical protein
VFLQGRGRSRRQWESLMDRMSSTSKNNMSTSTFFLTVSGRSDSVVS